jgi:electron transfer flavoprotein-quinone oxidoreductase
VEPDFDVIVVGAGMSGSIAAYLLAEKGHSVAVIERGDYAGAKNLSGGVFYSRVLDTVFPNWVEEAPWERKITRNVIGLVGREQALLADIFDPTLADPVNAVSVQRARFDPWLAEQAEGAGAFLMPSVRVDSAIVEDGKVLGVKAGDDELRSKVVIAADGINSFLARSVGLRQAPQNVELAVGVKATLKLPVSAIEDRFGIEGDQGAAFAMVGDVTQTVGGGAFLYTNKETLSFGVALFLQDLMNKGLKALEVWEHAFAHPALRRYFRDAEIVEYGSHLTGEAGIHMLGEIHSDGLIVIGDAAGMTINTGLTIRGMDFAVGSAISAAEGVDRALQADDTSKAGLAGYRQSFEASYLYKDMQLYSRAWKFLEHAANMYDGYPELIGDITHRIYDLDCTPRKHLVSTALKAYRQSGIKLGGVMRDGLGLVRAL